MHLSVFGSKLSRAFQPVVSRLVVAMTLYPCPPGHRALELADIEVGRQVTYITRDASMSRISTTIVQGMVFENDCVALKHKKLAAMSRVFVPVSAVGEGDAPAVGTDGFSAVGEFDPPADGTACASVAGEDDTVNDADVDDFLQKDVAPWMEQLQRNAASEGKSLAESLLEALTRDVGLTNPEEMVQAFKSAVPWGQGIVGFQAVPKSSKRGIIHISMLSFDKGSYAANGMFLHDASLLLRTQGRGGLCSKTLALRPRPGAGMTVFGWEPDGAVVNSTYAFACTCIVRCACEGRPSAAVGAFAPGHPCRLYETC
jgi:hypothetical protein